MIRALLFSPRTPPLLSRTPLASYSVYVKRDASLARKRSPGGTGVHPIGQVSALGEKFASGEGIQGALFTTSAMLFQTDEIDGMLQSINKARDGRHEGIMGTLLTMYSAANTIYPMRRKAGKEHPGAIDQPCLVLYGTAIPTHYYSALSERMLTNGFMSRMLVVESGRRSCGQEPGLIDPPDSILDVARWWADYRPGSGNLEQWHPEPRVVPATEHARNFLRDARREAEAEYARCEAENDAVGTTIWGRVHEQTRKLALLYAVSASHTDSEITAEAAEWAHALVMHQTRRMLFMADSHLAENPFHADCLKLLKKLREAPGQTISHSVLLPGHGFYVWGGYANVANYPPVFRACGLYFSQAIIWHKLDPVLTRKDFMGDHEWCFYGWREGAAHRFFGPKNVPDVWPVKKVNPNKMIHLTEKPVELTVRATQYSSLPGENVLDLFGGSGSTLIACEQTGRKALLMELDALYADVIVRRWEEFTGKKAERVEGFVEEVIR